jgi:hypothetical protein
MSLAGAISPYEKATDILWELGRIKVCRTAMEGVTEQEGERAQEWLEQRNNPVSGESGAKPQRLYVLTDGTTLPTPEGYKEVKLGAVFESRREDPEGPDEAGSVEYTAGLEGVEEFVPGLKNLAQRKGAGQAQEVVVLGDGAGWIWNRVPELFSGRVVQIVDWYHAQERLWNVSHLVFGEGSTRAKEWATQRKQELWEGKGPEVLRALQKLRPKGQPAKEYVRQSVGYYRENEHRMQYDEFRRQGYLIGSGIIESACKHIVAQRFKQSGMRWNPEHAQKLLGLRVCRASGLWDTFWQENLRRAA